ncbi:MAG: DUF2868 domain-containing protein [Desulfobacteraceae bacterium]|nr:DUF2868 domain-containing protein [Desulfobacteraceae bacterium]
MKMRLKDIINLDYLIRLDDSLESADDIQSRKINDRKIYSQCKGGSQTKKELLLSWLEFRKEEFFQHSDNKKLTLLPGDIFSWVYTWMVYAAIFLGGVTGISVAYSFLAYHGARPINVAVFIALFVFLQMVLILLTLILLVRKALRQKNQNFGYHNSIIHTLLAALFFNIFSRVLKKSEDSVLRKSLDKLEYTSNFIQMKNKEYKALFFWPFFMLTSICAFSFSTGALGGTFFRVIVSDMAFGWQTTLMTTSTTVHDMVSFIALPWSWFIPEALSHPGLEQIEGSRIILKEGISVLATQNLVSWWPFICMGVLFYAVIPRGLLIIIGIMAQNRVLAQFNFDRPRFKQLILKMQSPVLDINSHEIRVTPKNTIEKTNEMMSSKSEPDRTGGSALILSSDSVYSDVIIKKVIQYIETNLFFKVKERINIHFDLNADADAVQNITISDVDQVVLVHEVWQPPIRGLLHYIEQIKTAMPDNMSLWILLTQEAGSKAELKSLGVDANDINFKTWKKAVLNLKNPDIIVQRFNPEIS